VLFEPNAQELLSYLVTHYLNLVMYFALLNAKASEQSARMVSMKNATDSAEIADRRPAARIQQAAPGQHHAGAARNCRRPGRLRHA
jgi:hypothetical protein